MQQAQKQPRASPQPRQLLQRSQSWIQETNQHPQPQLAGAVETKQLVDKQIEILTSNLSNKASTSAA